MICSYKEQFQDSIVPFVIFFFDPQVVNLELLDSMATPQLQYGFFQFKIQCTLNR